MFQHEFLRRTFGEEVFDGFNEAYLAVLSALRDKDAAMLNDILEKNLVRDLVARDCEVVHDHSKIDTRVFRTFIGMGIPFERSKGNKVLLMK